MRRPRPVALPAAGLLALVALAAPASALAQGATAFGLEEVAAFDHQVTGVAVAAGGRIFVNFPRWTEDTAISVAEVGRDGRLRPYPDAAWNGWRNADLFEVPPGDRWVCVQSVVADGRGHLWVIDPAAPAVGPLVEGGPKLVRIDLATDRVERVYRFGPDVAPQGSYLNDVRFSPDGGHAYLADSGAVGALVVVDLRSGRARRVLDGHPSTQVEPEVEVMADGRPLRRPDGRKTLLAADGIAISNDGRHLFWQALTGRTLYRIPTAALDDPDLAPAALAARIEVAGINGVADGLLIDRRGRMWVTAPEEDGLRLRRGDRIETVISDPRLRWPDSLAEGPDGAIYVTASRIQDNAFYKPENGRVIRTRLFRLRTGAE